MVVEKLNWFGLGCPLSVRVALNGSIPLEHSRPHFLLAAAVVEREGFCLPDKREVWLGFSPTDQTVSVDARPAASERFWQVAFLSNVTKRF